MELAILRTNRFIALAVSIGFLLINVRDKNLKEFYNQGNLKDADKQIVAGIFTVIATILFWAQRRQFDRKSRRLKKKALFCFLNYSCFTNNNYFNCSWILEFFFNSFFMSRAIYGFEGHLFTRLKRLL